MIQNHHDMCLTKKLKTRFLFGLAIPATLPELSSLSTRSTESINFQSVKISPITHWPRWDVEMFHLISSAGLWETSRFTYGRWTGLLPILAGFEKMWNGGNHWRWIIRDTSIHLFWPRSKGQTAESLKEWAMETFLRIQCSQTILHTKYTSRYFQCFLILKVLKTVEKIHGELDIPMRVDHWGLELGSCLCCHGTVGDDFALGPSGQSKGRVFEIFFSKTRGEKVSKKAWSELYRKTTGEFWAGIQISAFDLQCLDFVQAPPETETPTAATPAEAKGKSLESSNVAERFWLLEKTETWHFYF